MTKKILFFSLLAGSVLMLAGCSQKPSAGPNIMEQSTIPAGSEGGSAADVQTEEGVKAQEEMLTQPTISNSTNTNDLSKELNDTQIKTEDFSDL